jgi:hypothetical protein
MIASSIGKVFLKEYNRRKNTSYTAKDFFEREFYPLFLDHPKYMQWITNSPFVQGIRKGQPPSVEERSEKLARLKEKLKAQTADASVAIGYPSLDDLATTSGQLTNLELPLNEEDYYASWIGGGLGVGVQGGFSIYFDHPEILWKICDGWSEYRKRLNQIDKLRANQIESWNGQWLAHVYKEGYIPDELFEPFETVQTGGYKGMIEIPTIQWTEVLIGIAKSFPNQILNGYVFSLDQTNTTVGFIPFHLPEIRKPIQFYIELFGESEYLNNARLIRSLYGTAFGFVHVCQMGVIGVKAMEPKDLKPYMMDQRQKSKMPDYSKANEKQQISFKTYQTWLLAMLDNKQLWDKAGEAAKAYLKYESEAKKLTTKHQRQVEEILDSPSKRKFIENNIAIVGSAGDASEAIHQLVEGINVMPEDSFRYFLTLIKFRYKFFELQQSETKKPVS